MARGSPPHTAFRTWPSRRAPQLPSNLPSQPSIHWDLMGSVLPRDLNYAFVDGVCLACTCCRERSQIASRAGSHTTTALRWPLGISSGTAGVLWTLMVGEVGRPG